jgi:putative spermidine/putrescine transport system substrate-binding protein/spermidine/putrescine transport system substrate-binding protein
VKQEEIMRIVNRKVAATGVSIALVAAMTIGQTGMAMAASGELGLLVWEGYADPSFVKDFEASSGCTVQATYVGSNDDFAPKLAAGGSVYDLMSVSSDAAGVLVAAGFVEPVDVSKIPEFGNIYEAFRTLPAINADGQVWGVPFTWGANPFIYRTDKIPTPPDTIAALWDPQYKGKVGMWDDKSMLYNTARMLGIADPFNMTDEELETVKNKLIEQKPLVRKYWGTAGELENLFASGEMWISYTWGGLMLNDLKKQNIPVAEFTPKEGADGWNDNWMIAKGSPNIDCAYEYINYMMSAKGQCGVSTVTGYSATNPVAAKTCMTPEEFSSKHQDDIGAVQKLHMWQALPRIEVYTNTWNAVKAAP